MAEGKKRLYKRTTANSALCNSLQLALSINNRTAEYPYIYYVSRLAVFGSLIRTLDNVHDVDIALDVIPIPELEVKRQTEAFANDHLQWTYTYFPSYASGFETALFFPYEAVCRGVKGHRGIISEHTFDELKQLACPYASLIFNGKLTPAGQRVLEEGGADWIAKFYAAEAENAENVLIATDGSSLVSNTQV
jgi:hypothetical protein